MSNKKAVPFTTFCVFLPYGQTFTFKEVELLTNNESTLMFRYEAMSDGLVKTAVFQKAKIVGYSWTYEG